jgi:hypothetical protein
MKRILIAISGGALLILGLALVVLPGPAVVVIPAALALLATEFLWARRALQRCRAALGKMAPARAASSTRRFDHNRPA